MIGQFFPSMIVASTGFIAAPGFATVNVKATSAATERANNVEWLEIN
jgi:hypothetical protein